MATVRFHLNLIDLAGVKKELFVDAKQPILLTTLLDGLGVPHEEVGIIVRNGRVGGMDCLIHDEDVIELFPILSGG
jgi:molybdopterin converting factor small subunit